MIQTRSDLREYLQQDAKANGRQSVRCKLWGDEIWRYIVTLRHLEYHSNQKGLSRRVFLPVRLCCKLRLHRQGVKLGFTIPINVFGKGLSIAHRGTIVVANSAVIGENCRIHEGVTIGATNGSSRAARLGNNVFLASGAKVIGDITIADDVAIAANGVVTRSITEKGTTWGGVPAKKISDRDSHSNLNRLLFPEEA